MLQEHDDRLRVIRARTILDMLGERPATGRDLFRPLRGLDNAALLVRGGRVLDVLPWKSVRVPAATPVTDMGDVTLMPGCINAHCHLQLSHTAGRPPSSTAGAPGRRAAAPCWSRGPKWPRTAPRPGMPCIPRMPGCCRTRGSGAA